MDLILSLFDKIWNWIRSSSKARDRNNFLFDEIAHVASLITSLPDGTGPFTKIHIQFKSLKERYENFGNQVIQSQNRDLVNVYNELEPIILELEVIFGKLARAHQGGFYMPSNFENEYLLLKQKALRVKEKAIARKR
ncbi:MAG: hypothetical protein MJK18_08150 [Bdellovibrionales bacterium]|nr:hypothetical protein [Bdellovibrionales bacterium]